MRNLLFSLLTLAFPFLWAQSPLHQDWVGPNQEQIEFDSTGKVHSQTYGFFKSYEHERNRLYIFHDYSKYASYADEKFEVSTFEVRKLTEDSLFLHPRNRAAQMIAYRINHQGVGRVIGEPDDPLTPELCFRYNIPEVVKFSSAKLLFAPVRVDRLVMSVAPGGEQSPDELIDIEIRSDGKVYFFASGVEGKNGYYEGKIREDDWLILQDVVRNSNFLRMNQEPQGWSSHARQIELLLFYNRGSQKKFSGLQTAFPERFQAVIEALLKIEAKASLEEAENPHEFESRGF